MINGYFLNVGSSLLGVVLRLLFVLVCFLFLIRNIKQPNVVFFLFLLVSLYTSSVISTIFSNGDFNQTIVMVLKTLMLPMVYCYFSLLNRDRSLTKGFIIKFIYFNSFILVLNGTCALLGFGFSQYEDGSGFGLKGFFYAGNELNITLIALYSLVCFYTLTDGKRGYFLLFSFVFLILAGMSGSKSPILGVFFLFLLSVSVFFKRSYKVFVLLVASLILSLLTYFLYDLIQAVVSRWMFFVDASDSLASGLSSGRVERLSEFVLLVTADPLLFVFGAGTGALNVEMDFFDFMITFGFIMTVIYFFWFFHTFLSLRYKSKKGIFLMISCLFISLVAFFSGHVFYSAMASPFIALLMISAKREMVTTSVN